MISQKAMIFSSNFLTHRFYTDYSYIKFLFFFYRKTVISTHDKVNPDFSSFVNYFWKLNHQLCLGYSIHPFYEVITDDSKWLKM